MNRREEVKVLLKGLLVSKVGSETRRLMEVAMSVGYARGRLDGFEHARKIICDSFVQKGNEDG